MKYTKKMSDNNKKKKVIIVSVIVAMLVTAGAAFWVLGFNPEGYTTLTPAQAQALIKSNPNVMLVDVRGPDELRSGWIDGSVLMPVTEIMQGRMVPPKNRPILLICAVGGRSLGLGKTLALNGWPEVYNLQGGIAEWRRQGLPLRYQ